MIECQISTELRAVDSECICERTTKFRSEILFDSRVILIFRYRCKMCGFNTVLLSRLWMMSNAVGLVISVSRLI